MSACTQTFEIAGNEAGDLGVQYLCLCLFALMVDVISTRFKFMSGANRLIPFAPPICAIVPCRVVRLHSIATAKMPQCNSLNSLDCKKESVWPIQSCIKIEFTSYYSCNISKSSGEIGVNEYGAWASALNFVE